MCIENTEVADWKIAMMPALLLCFKAAEAWTYIVEQYKFRGNFINVGWFSKGGVVCIIIPKGGGW